YPLALVLACLVLPGSAADVRPFRERLWDAAIPAVVLVLSAAAVTADRGWADTPAGGLALALDSGLPSPRCWRPRARPGRFARALDVLRDRPGRGADRRRPRLLHLPARLPGRGAGRGPGRRAAAARRRSGSGLRADRPRRLQRRRRPDAPLDAGGLAALSREA